MEDEDIICIVAVCKECGKAVIYKYVKNGSGQINTITTGFHIPTSGLASVWYDGKPTIEWCHDCDSDEPRHLCKVGSYDTPGFLDKCDGCGYKFSCASSRIEVIFEGVK